MSILSFRVFFDMEGSVSIPRELVAFLESRRTMLVRPEHVG